MSIAMTTTEDFRSTKTFASAPDSVFSALTDVNALTRWWTPAGGGASAGQTLRFLMGDQEVVMRVDEALRPSRVRWSVLVCEPASDWVGTSITFDLEQVGTPAPSCTSATMASTPTSNASISAAPGGPTTSPASSTTSTWAPAARTPPADVERFAASRASDAAL